MLSFIDAVAATVLVSQLRSGPSPSQRLQCPLVLDCYLWLWLSGSGYSRKPQQHEMHLGDFVIMPFIESADPLVRAQLSEAWSAKEVGWGIQSSLQHHSKEKESLPLVVERYRCNWYFRGYTMALLKIELSLADESELILSLPKISPHLEWVVAWVPANQKWTNFVRARLSSLWHPSGSNLLLSERVYAYVWRASPVATSGLFPIFQLHSF